MSRNISGVTLMFMIIAIYVIAVVLSIAIDDVEVAPTERKLELPQAPFVGAGAFNRTWGFQPTQEGLKCLALNAYFEARNDTLAGKVAVSQVVMNRVEDSRFPDTICEVVQHSYFSGLHKCQFSWYCDGLRDEPMLQHRQEAEAWEESQHAARLVINGEFEKYITATNYHSIHVDPEWANKLEFIGQVGLHRFYLDDR